MEPQTFSVSAHTGAHEGQHVLLLKGPLTCSSAPAFYEAAHSAEAASLIVDLTEVPFVDSSAIGVLVRVYVSCQKRGRRLALVGLTHRVENVLRITGVDPLFDTYPTLSDAEKGLA